MLQWGTLPTTMRFFVGLDPCEDNVAIVITESDSLPRGLVGGICSVSETTKEQLFGGDVSDSCISCGPLDR